jgi:hypothetical protein
MSENLSNADTGKVPSKSSGSDHSDGSRLPRESHAHMVKKER